MRSLLVWRISLSVFTLIITTAICLTALEILTLFHYKVFNGYYCETTDVFGKANYKTDLL